MAGRAGLIMGASRAQAEGAYPVPSGPDSREPLRSRVESYTKKGPIENRSGRRVFRLSTDDYCPPRDGRNSEICGKRMRMNVASIRMAMNGGVPRITSR